MEYEWYIEYGGMVPKGENQGSLSNVGVPHN